MIPVKEKAKEVLAEWKNKQAAFKDRALRRWRKVQDPVNVPFSKEKKLPKNPKTLFNLERMYKGKRYSKMIGKINRKRHADESMFMFKKRRKVSNKRRRLREAA